MSDYPTSTAVTAPALTPGHDTAGLCGAQRRRSEALCRRPAGWGTPHPGIGRCKLHGGSTPTHTASAARRATDDEARALLERLGRPDPLGDPVEELLGLGAEVRAYLGVLRERLAELRDFSSHDVALIDRERAVVKLYGEALDRTHRVLADLARLGLDERLVRVREAQAGALLAAFTRALGSVGLSDDQQRAARRAFALELRPGSVDTRLTSAPVPRVVHASDQGDREPDLLTTGPLSGENA